MSVTLKYGMPQGSILGPVLLTLYTVAMELFVVFMEMVISCMLTTHTFTSHLGLPIRKPACNTPEDCGLRRQVRA